jgi:hypothetical protein
LLSQVPTTLHQKIQKPDFLDFPNVNDIIIISDGPLNPTEQEEKVWDILTTIVHSAALSKYPPFGRDRSVAVTKKVKSKVQSLYVVSPDERTELTQC